MVDFNTLDLLKAPPEDPFSAPIFLCRSCCGIHYEHTFVCKVCGLELFDEIERPPAKADGIGGRTESPYTG